MAAMYRNSPRILRLCRQRGLVGQSYHELSKSQTQNITRTLALSRCMSDSAKSKPRIDFDNLDIGDQRLHVEEKLGAVDGSSVINKENSNDEIKMTKMSKKKMPDVDMSDTIQPGVEETYIEQSNVVNTESTDSSDRIPEIDGEFINKKEKETYRQKVDKLITSVDKLDNPEAVLDNLTYVLQTKGPVSFVGPLIVKSFRKLEALNYTELSKKDCTEIDKYLNTKHNVAHLSMHDFNQILNFLVKGKEDTSVSENLLHEACWRFRNAPIAFIIDILSTVSKSPITTKRREVIQEAEKKIIDGIGNISTPSLMLSVMYLLMPNKAFRSILEDEMLLMIPAMDFVQTSKCLHLLTMHGSKNLSAINKVKHHLKSRPVPENLDMKKLLSVLRLCESQRIHDQVLLQNLSIGIADCINKSTNVSLNDLLLIMNTCSRMNWRNDKLLDSVIDIMQNRQLDYTTNDKLINMAYLILSVGHLNLSQYSKFSQTLVRNLHSLKVDRPALWLDIVQSMACINGADADAVKTVLDADFYQPVLDSLKDNASKQDNIRRKLLTLYGYLKLDLGDTTSQYDDVATEWRKQLQENASKELRRMSKPVGEVLSHFAPLEVYTKTNVVTQFGANIDFELVVDDIPKAVRVDESAQGKHRIWIKVQEFYDYVQNGSDDPTYSGSTAMSIRHLAEEKHVRVIYVSYLDWNKLDKSTDKLNYLESKIKQAVIS